MVEKALFLYYIPIVLVGIQECDEFGLILLRETLHEVFNARKVCTENDG